MWEILGLGFRAVLRDLRTCDVADEFSLLGSQMNRHCKRFTKSLHLVVPLV